MYLKKLDYDLCLNCLFCIHGGDRDYMSISVLNIHRFTSMLQGSWDLNLLALYLHGEQSQCSRFTHLWF